MHRVFRLASWIMSLCLLVQAVAASAGGVLCIGCAEVDSGVRIAAAVCAPEMSSCREHTELSADDASAPECGSIHSPADCGCVDVNLAPYGEQIAIHSHKCAKHHPAEAHGVGDLPHVSTPAALWPTGGCSVGPRPHHADAHKRSPLSLRTVLRI